MKNYDVQVLGAGIVGRSLALALARAGLTVALRPQATRAPGTDDVPSNALAWGSSDAPAGVSSTPRVHPAPMTSVPMR